MDLFPSPIGHGNAILLADIAQRVPIEQIRSNRKAGKYHPLWPGAAHWLKLAGYRV